VVIDHVVIGVGDVSVSRAFIEAVCHRP